LLTHPAPLATRGRAGRGAVNIDALQGPATAGPRQVIRGRVSVSPCRVTPVPCALERA